MMVTREADYAIRVVQYLARKENESRAMSSAVMAEAMDIPYRFLRNIVRRMVDAGLVESRRGKGGGVMLARPCNMISLYDVLAAIDPTMTRLNICLDDSHVCSRKHRCTVHPAIRRIQAELDAGLKSITFER